MLPLRLYDTPGKHITPWNPAPLRTRYCLGIKGIPYTTTWVEYPELEPTLRSLGAASTMTIETPDGNSKPLYTIPVIADPNNLTEDGKPTIIADSLKIAAYLDERYPEFGSTTLVPEGTEGLQTVYEDYIFKIFVPPIRGLVIPLFYDNLNNASKPYFRKAREAFMGQKIEDMCIPGSKEREEAWAGTKKALGDMATILDNRDVTGPFIGGATPCFADFTFASLLEVMSKMLPAKEWEEVTKWNEGRWENLRKECAKYLKGEIVVD